MATHIKDLGLSLAKGIVAVPEAAVGLADLATGGKVGKFLENKDGDFGFRLNHAKDIGDDMQSDGFKAKHPPLHPSAQQKSHPVKSG